MGDSLWVILALGVLTYSLRSAGHVLIARFGVLHPRVEAALNAVPAAVLTTLVVPNLVQATWMEWTAAAIAVALSFRFSMMVVVFGATFALAVIRTLFG